MERRGPKVSPTFPNMLQYMMGQAPTKKILLMTYTLEGETH